MSCCDAGDCGKKAVAVDALASLVEEIRAHADDVAEHLYFVSHTADDFTDYTCMKQEHDRRWARIRRLFDEYIRSISNSGI